MEDFEDGALNTPGASANGSWSTGIPRSFTDSVDGDDGVLDGSGRTGRSYFSESRNNTLTISFSAAALGGSLPTDVGIVWTDANASTANRQVVFSAVDATGASLGSIGPYAVGDDFLTGQTAEDRFFGISNAAGISSITISMPGSNNWEVDHLQYGLAPVPEPESYAMMLAGLGLLATVVRNRKPLPS